MLGRESLIGSVVMAIKEHSVAFGIAGAVAGAILVIIYCGSIKYYPVGLTIADTLFFLWVVAVFGFYYSLIVVGFFLASLFWVTIFARPINYLAKKKKRKMDIVIPIPKTDWILVIIVGFFCNIFIFLISLQKEHSILAVISALIFIGLIYITIENVARAHVNSANLLDSQGNPIKINAIPLEVLKFIFYVFLYTVPMVYGQVWGGVTRTTFETMGVRQISVDIAINAESYNSLLKRHTDRGYLSGYSCEEVCILENVNILFTNVGSSTKFTVEGKLGTADLVIPTESISMISKYIPKK